MTDAIVIESEVEAGIDQAFEVWTDKCAVWWPRSHSMSQSSDFRVVFEPRVGGDIFEVGPDGARHDWGRITVWEPPHRIEYLWHIFMDPASATRVSVTFEELGSRTRVRLENDGFEIFGDEGDARKERVSGAWGSLIELYQNAI